ncbi:MAG: hypothetical protein CME62_10600 [Halobacteriovoraceae bacterium]|nr:hypothetical protein [Halobacteriovoraceae bacterium]|tara:strand:+ start:4057 stop:5451 length:1395 start_codon:yes stop_codon:yes gene_type:complete
MKFKKSKKNFKKDLMGQYNNLFASQDSKFFIVTATKLTLIPLFSFCIIFYSLWTIMEMNFNFFVANGFNSGELFKEAFYDSIFMGVSDYIPFFFGVIISVFLSGLFVSWLTLRSFDQIELFANRCNEGNINDDFHVSGLNKSKLVNQVSRIFFKYLQICEIDGKRPRFKLPKKLDQLNHPPLDKVFLLQYALIVSALCLVTNIIFFTFTNELYLELVTKGLELLEPNRVVNNFLKSQEAILFNIYSIAIGCNILLYALISRNIIKSVDGVSFGFARDMLRVIKGEHETRLRPRYADPGKSVASSINLYLDQVFPFIEDENELDIEEVTNQTVQSLNQHAQHEQDEDDLDTIISDFPKTVDMSEEEIEDFMESEEHEETAEQIHSQHQPQFDVLENHHFEEEFEEENELHETGEQEVNEDLPPVFIEEKQVVGGEKVFHITTPEGLKVENLDADMLLRIVKETKK